MAVLCFVLFCSWFLLFWFLLIPLLKLICIWIFLCSSVSFTKHNRRIDHNPVERILFLWQGSKTTENNTERFCTLDNSFIWKYCILFCRTSSESSAVRATMQESTRTVSIHMAGIWVTDPPVLSVSATRKMLPMTSVHSSSAVPAHPSLVVPSQVVLEVLP